MPPPPPSPHRAALLSLAALESLKRDQLVKLAKRFDLKANGKVSQRAEWRGELGAAGGGRRLVLGSELVCMECTDLAVVETGYRILS